MITRCAFLFVFALATLGVAAALPASISAQSPPPLFTLDPAVVPDAASPNARGLRVSPDAIEQLRNRVLGGELPAVLLNFDVGLAFGSVPWTGTHRSRVCPPRNDRRRPISDRHPRHPRRPPFR